MKKLLNQIWKFGIVGGLSFLVDFGIFTFLSQIMEVHYLIANFFGFIISAVLNYLLSMKYVFVRKDNADKRIEFILFVVLSASGLIINELIILGCIEGIYKNFEILYTNISQNHAELFGKIVATGIVMVYNFITRKVFLEKKD